MGLTNRSTGLHIRGEESGLNLDRDAIVVGLAGNPNVGKSTVFNALTGLNQHTGNWPGKTVSNARGDYTYSSQRHLLVDLPGTYSLIANSPEEEIARNFLCFSHPDVVIVVVDATCLLRNLNLVLQTLEITSRVVLCINLMDEAKKKQIEIHPSTLSQLLKIPVILTSARNGKGLDELRRAVLQTARRKQEPQRLHIDYGPVLEAAVRMVQSELEPLLLSAGSQLSPRWCSLRALEENRQITLEIRRELALGVAAGVSPEDSVPAEFPPSLLQAVGKAQHLLQVSGVPREELHDCVVRGISKRAEEIFSQVVVHRNPDYHSRDVKLDRVLTSRRFGIPLMIILLFAVFWLTITGANYPSQWLSQALFSLEPPLLHALEFLHAPEWLSGILVLGIYRTLAWIVSVMLPPMAIFFPLFTLLEDAGYLPRVAFNLDHSFQRACTCGKQALTMCMGFGCNAAGVIGTRIIDSPRERLIAIITNSLVPCNGRFPLLIAISAMFFSSFFLGPFQSIGSALVVTAFIVLGVCLTFAVSRFLSKTLLKGMPSSFTLELPPYRRPQIGKVIVRSIFDRTLFVLGRAVCVAIPAGALIWLMANLSIDGASLLAICGNFLDPFARLMGMDGYILLAFILGFPANEIVIPIMLMCYLSSGYMMEYESLTQLHTLLVSQGWTWLTALNVMIFSLVHFPCATTLWTIRKESQSTKWTLVSLILPTVLGILLCMLLNGLGHLLALV